MHTCDLLAIDIGASSGRGILGHFNGKTLKTTETHRFGNGPKLLSGKYYWDIIFMLDNIYQSIALTNRDLAGIGVDTWGVDFAFLDANGVLIGNPRSYRDPAFNKQNLEETITLMGGEKDLFSLTSVAALEYNSLCQLHSMVKNNEVSEEAKHLLMMPNLIEYFLSGIIHSEYSIISTTQLFDMRQKRWTDEIIKKLGLNEELFSSVDYAGRKLGGLLPSVQKELGHSDTSIISVAGHDTACAGMAVPAKDDGFAFISSGSMSLFGVETTQIVDNNSMIKDKIGNEGTSNGDYRLTINMNGLWVINSCKQYWNQQGMNLSFDELVSLARKAKPLRCFINTADYKNPGNYPLMIQEYCKKTNQFVPETVGEITRCIYESLALEYKSAYMRLKKHIKNTEELYIVGGGAKNQLLNQLTANSIGIPVITGPSEATTVGNMVVQLEALGELSGREQRNDLIISSFKGQVYLPEDCDMWQEAFERYSALMNNTY